MIKIPLPIASPLSHTFSYSVSPLYELAASLHTLAQLNPPERLADWCTEKISHIQIARLMKDWEYLLPLFRYGIPDSFDPFQTKGVMAVNDQYEYFVTLPTDQFVRSLSPALEEWNQHHIRPQVADDLLDDSDYVKGRFSLFVSSYWQLSFEANWETIAPLFVKEAERIHLALENAATAIELLQSIFPALRYEEAEHCLYCPIDCPPAEVQQLILYPSYYYFAGPLLTKKGKNAHLLYSFSPPTASTKNAL
ncbi:hypothetical protein [Brevibacillus centrosporus]|uniref:Uncharacterized protein n=1 Tax=Brevibacillus centrosporus TaxID=54910 RepID=A0A1I3P799_9BACL|nr:hypothetical protein [Brevibacillus centrosporus]MED4909998.1 hypothetical protein [Brevibacillus centrosporus]SFJ17210.1 hypothetical protein SAMN05518846_102275 [Brevibacillus centrosporus]